jgi:hypothetical protein
VAQDNQLPFPLLDNVHFYTISFNKTVTNLSHVSALYTLFSPVGRNPPAYFEKPSP